VYTDESEGSMQKSKGAWGFHEQRDGTESGSVMTGRE